MSKQIYYSWDKIYATDSTYMIALGARNLGKSYDAKKRSILEAMDSQNNKFALIRRFREDVKPTLIEQYFADMDIEALTGGKFKNIRVFNGAIYLANYNLEDMKWEPLKIKIGYYFPLSSAQHFKSTMYPDVKNIIFEEFISDTYYLPQEPYKLDSIISTISRQRPCKVFCIGNTINRMCPYFGYWSLDKVLRQQQGTIDLYNFKNEDGDTINVAVEMSALKGKQSMFFGKSQSMTVNGHWQSESHPRLANDFDNYTCYHTIFLFKESLKYRMLLLKDNDNNNYVWFVEPFTKEFKNKPHTRIIGDIYNEDMYVTNKFTPLNDKERIAFNLLAIGKIAYADNLTGTEFLRIYEELR